MLLEALVTTDRADHETNYYVQPQTGISCAEIIGDLPFNIGCIIKYVWRHENKNGKRDVEKAIQYAKIEIEASRDIDFGLLVSNVKSKFQIIEKYAEFEKKTYKADIFRTCINYIQRGEMGCLYQIIDDLETVLKIEYP